MHATVEQKTVTRTNIVTERQDLLLELEMAGQDVSKLRNLTTVALRLAVLKVTSPGLFVLPFPSPFAEVR